MLLCKLILLNTIAESLGKSKVISVQRSTSREKEVPVRIISRLKVARLPYLSYISYMCTSHIWNWAFGHSFMLERDRNKQKVQCFLKCSHDNPLIVLIVLLNISNISEKSDLYQRNAHSIKKFNSAIFL